MQLTQFLRVHIGVGTLGVTRADRRLVRHVHDAVWSKQQGGWTKYSHHLRAAHMPRFNEVLTLANASLPEIDELVCGVPVKRYASGAVKWTVDGSRIVSKQIGGFLAG